MPLGGTIQADHAPFSIGAAALASRFGVGMSDGYLVVGPQSEATGTIDYDVLRSPEQPILTGANKGRSVGSVRLFMGQSLTAPKGAHALLTLPQGATVFPDRAAIAAYRGGGPRGGDVSGKPQAVAPNTAKVALLYRPKRACSRRKLQWLGAKSVGLASISSTTRHMRSTLTIGCLADCDRPPVSASG